MPRRASPDGPAGGLATRYAALLRGTGAAPALAFSLLGRLSLSTTGLALLLLVREHSGSYAAAGAVAASYAAAFAVFAPVRARRADRRGPRGILLTCAALHAPCLGGLVVLAGAGAAAPLLVTGAVLAGATVPPLGGVMRALWGRLVPAAELATAYSLESVVVEACFVAGPLLVAGLTAASGPAAAVLTAAGLVLAGGIGLASVPALRRVRPHLVGDRRPPSPLRSPVVRSLLATIGLVGAGFGSLEVSLPAFAEAHAGKASTAGVLLAVWSGGSILGGLVYGAVRPRAAPDRQLPWLVGALALGAVLPLLAPSALAMGALLVLYGLTIAPYSTCNSVLLGAAAPAGTTTEAFAWSSSLIFGGAALGNAGAGALVQHGGARLGLALTAATGLLALLASLAGRAALRRAPLPV